ncbi:MAG: hypothetical protein RI885_2309 [Actinomycetota bacterium]
MDQALTSGSGGYRGLSLWFDQVAEAGDALTPRVALDGNVEADVAIVGGGLTGLWTAWYLLERDPRLRIIVLEKEIAGFGASGRNGGWCSALFPRSTESLARTHGRAAATAQRQAMIDTVDEVGRAARQAGIDCDFAKGGTLVLARTAVQLAAARADVAAAAAFGVDRPTLVDGPGGHPAVFDPDCARLQPGSLVRGLARALEARGVIIHEQTEVVDWMPRRVATVRGSVKAQHVVIALEGYRATVARASRDILPLYSLMIATEPLPDAVWHDIGIAHGQTFTDYRHLLIYGQRTADNRFAFGGRGARYHWGSAIRPSYDRVERVFEHLAQTLGELFPAAATAEVTHRWGGPLGVPRDWHASVRYDRRSGIGSAGGYVGDGLSTTNLAGRTLADLLTGEQTDLTALPWVDHRSPRWEPEPLRFLGSNLGLAAMATADLEERMTHRPSIVARAMGPLVGH